MTKTNLNEIKDVLLAQMKALNSTTDDETLKKEIEKAQSLSAITQQLVSIENVELSERQTDLHEKELKMKAFDLAAKWTPNFNLSASQTAKVLGIEDK